jgi:hypothetical protein
MTADQIWQAVLSELQLQMTKATFDTWAKNTRVVECADGVFTIGAQDAFAKEWLENRLLTTVERTLVGIVGRPVEVKFVVKQELVPAGSSPPKAEEQTEVGLRPVYLSTRSAIVQPEKGITVTSYSMEHWLPRLGVHRWALVQLLRNLCANLPRRPDGTKWLTVTWKDLAAHLEVRADTLGEWLRHEPILGNRPWRHVVPVDEKAIWLAMFIPRLRYVYRREGGKTRRVGFLLEVMMEDPLIPEHEEMVNQVVDQQKGVNLPEPDLQATLPPPVTDPQPDLHKMVKLPQPYSQAAVKLSQPDLHPCKSPQTGGNVNELTTSIGNLDLALTSRKHVRKALRSIVKEAENILEDHHSTAMFHKVLLALYPDHLKLFSEAVEEAVAIGQDDPGANKGAIFVATLKELAAEAGVELGLKGA